MYNIDYEFYFMSGLPIDLRSKGLGILHQPTIKDFIENKMDVSIFSHPFLFGKEIVMGKKESIDEIIKDLGKLGFLIVYDKMTSKEGEDNEGTVLNLLERALKILYKTDNVRIWKTISKIEIDGSIAIGDEELQFLSNLIIEMLRVDREAVLKKLKEKEKKAEQDALMDEFDRRERAYLEKTKGKSKELTLLDMMNVIIHSQETINYEKAFDMTVYQLRNSYETLIKKESFNINLMHRISPNFKPSDDLKLWEENAHIVKSNLNSSN